MFRRLLILLLSLSVSALAVEFHGPVRVDDGTSNAYTASPALTDGDHGILAAWTDSRAQTYGRSDVYCALSTDGGSSWSNPNRRINDDGVFFHYNPDLTWGGGYYHAVWTDGRDDSGDAYYSRSSDGVNWSADTRLSPDNGNSQSRTSIIYTPGGLLVAGWWDNDPDNPDTVWIRCSTDQGASWSSAVRVDTQGDAGVPELAVDAAGLLYCIYQAPFNDNRDVWCATSSNGTSWSTPVRVNEITASYQCNPAAVGGPAGTVHVVHRDMSAGDWDIRHNRSTDSGVSFDPSARLDPGDEERQDIPVIAADGDHLVCVFEQHASPQTLMFTESVDGGQSWSTPVVIDPNPNNNHQNPALILADGEFLLITEEVDSNSQRLFVYSTAEFSAAPVVELRGRATDEGALLSWEVEGAVSLLLERVEEFTTSELYRGAAPHDAYLDAVPAGEWQYRLTATSIAGEASITEVAVKLSDPTTRLQLDQPWPNPASGIVNLAFTLDVEQSVTLSLYDVSGRLTDTLLAETRAAGRHSLSYDCSGLSPGAYLLRLSSEEQNLTQSLIVNNN